METGTVFQMNDTRECIVHSWKVEVVFGNGCVREKCNKCDTLRLRRE